MKKKFSISWKGSKQPRKQRKYLFNVPLHIKRRMLNANLSKELRKKHSIRSLPLRKGDAVRIMAGDFKGKKSKVVETNLAGLTVFLEGMQKTKKDGTKINVPFKASNLQITEINIDDKKRKEAIERKNKEKIKEAMQKK